MACPYRRTAGKPVPLSSGLVYNTFPWPETTPAQRARIEALAQAVLDARAAYATSSLADLYDPDTMPPALRKAHAALDSAVDKLYRSAPFASDPATGSSTCSGADRSPGQSARTAGRRQKQAGCAQDCKGPDLSQNRDH